MSKLVFDIESDGLFVTVKKIWVLVTHDIENDEVNIFSDHDANHKPLLAGLEYLYNADALIGHNIIGYDLLVFRKILNWTPNPKTKIIDTMLLSQVINYNRFNGKHSLAVWGKFLGHEKPEHEDWSQYSAEMLHRCVEDVGINVKVYKHLMRELSTMATKKPYIKTSIKNEHTTAQFCADAEYNGWMFDKPKALALLAAMDEEMLAVQKLVEPKLRVETKRVDKEPKVPKWIKSGNYDAFTARYFSISPDTGPDDNRLVEGPYSRIEFVQPDLGNIDSVKLYLHTIGWEPDDWNWKKKGNVFEKVSEKLTTSSLEKLGEVGQLIDKYYTTRSRHSILKGWLEGLDDQDRLHGSCFTIATPTGRARHSGIVNVPSADAAWGADIRRLFIASPGYTIIGADSSGNQFRALCHYLKNDEYTNEVLNGDVHQKNADVLTSIMVEEQKNFPKVIRETTVSRKLAKPFIYAYLFGAGGEKVSLILTGMRNAKLGNKIKAEFAKRIPGLSELIKKVNTIFEKTSYSGDPWIPALDGRMIPCESAHKSLNYLLQSCEAVTCKGATAMAYDRLKEEGIPFNPLIFYHDEIEFEVPHEYAERAAQIAKEAFRDAPKLFGVDIMDGESKIGKDWYEVH
jgi:DNA polymerase I-like protein with 3'-5' exonuclease and polymerase domains